MPFFKKTLVLLLLFTLLFCTSGCREEIKEISCEDIIAAYEDAGYHVSHGMHNDEADNSWLCYIKAEQSDDPDSDYIYITTYFTEEQAKKAAEEQKYHPLLWFFGVLFDEARWLKSKSYGKIAYSYYNADTAKPFENLTK